MPNAPVKTWTLHPILVSIAMLGWMTASTLVADEVDIMIEAADWVAKELSDLKKDQNRNVDETLGAELQGRLESLQVDLERKIRSVDRATSTKLREQLEIASSLRSKVDTLLEGYPSPEELERYRKEVKTHLDQLAMNLGKQERRVTGIDERLKRIEELIGPVDEPYSVPGKPRVAIVVLGEPTLAGILEAGMEERLPAYGLDAASGRGSLRVNDLLNRYHDGVPIGDLAPLLVLDGFHVLVLARVEVVGYRDLYYLGRHSEATNARLRIDAYRLHGQRALGRGWNQPVEYTLLNVDQKAKEVLRGVYQDLTRVIEQGWQDYREDLASSTD